MRAPVRAAARARAARPGRAGAARAAARARAARPGRAGAARPAARARAARPERAGAAPPVPPARAGPPVRAAPPAGAARGGGRRYDRCRRNGRRCRCWAGSFLHRSARSARPGSASTASAATSACAEQCKACDVATSRGTCTQVTSGAPHGVRGACAGTNSCAGACSAASATACTYPGADVTCRGASCAGATLTLRAGCNGAGACPATATMSCGDLRMQCERHGVPGHVHVRRALRDRRATVLRRGRLCRRAIERFRLPVDARVRERPVRRRRLLQRRLRRVVPGLRRRRTRRNLLARHQQHAARRASGLRRDRRVCRLLQRPGVRSMLLPRRRDHLPLRSSRRHLQPGGLVPDRGWALPLAVRRVREICVERRRRGAERAQKLRGGQRRGWRNSGGMGVAHPVVTMRAKRRDVLGSQGPAGKPPLDGPDGRRRRGGGRVRGARAPPTSKATGPSCCRSLSTPASATSACAPNEVSWCKDADEMADANLSDRGRDARWIRCSRSRARCGHAGGS